MQKAGEIKYYSGFCLKHPRWWPAIFDYCFGRVLIRGRDKISLQGGAQNNLRHYPVVIREQVAGIAAPLTAADDWFAGLPATGWSPQKGQGIMSWPVPLATYSRNFGDIDWFGEERDQEDTYALHRFGWLIRWLSQRPEPKDLPEANTVIFDWLSQVSPKKNHLAWETYSVSERVVNWLLYLCATRDYQHFTGQDVHTLAAALLAHLDYIAGHLEYHDKACNNHILNNARALYIGGRILGVPQLAELARSLFRRHLPELIDEEGVLKEASTHYQLLLTRTMAEVWWVARATDDREYADYLSCLVCLMISVCRYMSDFVRNDFSDEFPLIGDVSPDYPVAWFSPRPGGKQEMESWWKLWGDDEWRMVEEVQIPLQHIAAGLRHWRWLTARQGALRLFVYLPEDSTDVYPQGHGHMDFGSFLLYDGEGPIFVDRGRCSYNADQEGQYGFSAKSHNTTLINGLPIVPNCQGVYLAYRQCLNMEQSVLAQEKGDKQIITWETGSVERLGKSLKWQREMTLWRDRLEIIETIDNPRNIDLSIATYWQIAPGWELVKNEHDQEKARLLIRYKAGRSYQFAVESNGCFSLDVYKGVTDKQNGWHSPNYGVRVPAVTLRVSWQLAGSSKSSFILCPI